MGADVSAEEDARERALALLRATHQFPCEYAFTVIAFNRDSVTEAVRRAAARLDDPAADGSREARHELRESSAGKYLSHRLALWVSEADEVLELYARLKTIEGVVTIL